MCPDTKEAERHFLLAAIRRTLSLSKAFKQSIETQNGQVAGTLVRIHLDTLARSYALYWADETNGMSAESFAKEVAAGRGIQTMKLRGAKQRATDRWLIEQIEGLGEWIPKVYKATSGAIHFSDFHINQMLQQATEVKQNEDGSINIQLIVGPTEIGVSSEHYRELKQAFLHITLMLVEAIRGRLLPPTQ